jgi:3-mercaptopyruvate sulfurtransferase SseA
LRAAGIDNARALLGGFAAWVKNGGEVTAGPKP